MPAHRRDQLERLLQYTARGAVALERLAEDAHGDLVYTFTKPWADGTTGIRLSPLELLEKLAALVPLPRVHLVRYAGCLAPHSKLREAIIPTQRQQGVDGKEAQTGTPAWSLARLLGRVFALDMATSPFCRQGVRRMIAAITQVEVIRKILRHLNYSAITDNSESCQRYMHLTRRALFKWLNRRSQRKSYTWDGFLKVLRQVGWPQVRVRVNLNPFAPLHG